MSGLQKALNYTIRVICRVRFNHGGRCEIESLDQAIESLGGKVPVKEQWFIILLTLSRQQDESRGTKFNK